MSAQIRNLRTGGSEKMKIKQVCRLFLLSTVILSTFYYARPEGRGSVQGNPSEKISPLDIGRKAAESVLGRKTGMASFLNVIIGREEINYSMVCSRYGVLIFADAVGDKGLLNRVIEAYQPFLEGKRHPRRGIVDYNVFGIVPFELYRQTGNKEYLPLALKLADSEFKRVRRDGLSSYSRFWVDDMYMVGSLQIQAYKSTGKIMYLDRATDHILAYCRSLQQSNGLFHHNLKSPFFWGRGNGWAAASMTELLLAAPQDYPRKSDVLDAYKKLMKGLIGRQDKDGMWHQLLDDPGSYPESSSTGMFVFAIATGLRMGWLPEIPFKDAAERAWNALAGHVDGHGNVRAVCVATGAVNNKTHYLERPQKTGDLHGQAALLWAATAIYKLGSWQ